MTHTLPNLRYGADALEPYIDRQTMELHYGKHHAGYVKNLNAALVNHPELQDKSVEDLLQISTLFRPTSARAFATTAGATPTTRCSGSA